MTNEKPKNKEFQKLFSEVQKMRKRYLITLASDKIFRRLSKLTIINIMGKKKAERNAKIFGNYVYFFPIVKEATRCYFLIELAKFFDPLKQNNETLTVFWALNYAEKNIHRLTKNDFKKYHDKMQIDPVIFATYKQLKIADLKKFYGRLEKNKDVIKKLKDYRDKYLAHDDINKKIEVKLTIQEIKVLLRIVKDTIELFYNKLEFAGNSYMNFEQEPVRDINRLIEDLAEHEKLRLKKNLFPKS